MGTRKPCETCSTSLQSRAETQTCDIPAGQARFPPAVAHGQGLGLSVSPFHNLRAWLSRVIFLSNLGVDLVVSSHAQAPEGAQLGPLRTRLPMPLGRTTHVRMSEKANLGAF